jgi:hypothetical protein
MEENPVQLRLGFDTPRSPVRVPLTLAGLQVVAGVTGSDVAVVASYLGSVGVAASVSEDVLLTFPVADLRKLLTLPAQVELVPREDLAQLWTMIARPSFDSRPVVVTYEGDERFNVSWFDGQISLNEPLPSRSTPAFMALEVPFVADSETWDELLAASRLPVLLGRARVNLDGFVEIVTTQPQRVQTSPLRALFRLDETHYGVPLGYADDVSNTPGFIWEGRRPSYDKPPTDLPDLPFELSSHARSDLRGLVDRLSQRRAEAVVWGRGLGRRVFSLAAIEALDAFPLIVVTFPHAVWAWQRHLDLLGRTYSLTHDRADVHIVTYRDLLSRTRLPSPASVIFDDLHQADAEQLDSLHRLDGLLDAYRIACSPTFPETASEAVALMSVLKPAEFRRNIPLSVRYPTRPEARAKEHVESYISRRNVNNVVDHGFRRSSVELIPPTIAQQQALDTALGSTRELSESLAEALLIVSAGPSSSISPKVSRAVEIAREDSAKGLRTAIVTRHHRTAQMVRAALRPLSVASVDQGDQVDFDTGVSITVIRAENRIGDLRGFDHVVFVDYPWSSLALESAIGGAGDSRGPQRVTCLHLDCPVDDRSALLAARRRELGAVTDHFAPLSDDEIIYLLSLRL